jgi:hypothetical protein
MCSQPTPTTNRPIPLTPNRPPPQTTRSNEDPEAMLPDAPKPTQDSLKEEVRDMAKKMAVAGINLLVIDTENKFVSTGECVVGGFLTQLGRGCCWSGCFKKAHSRISTQTRHPPLTAAPTHPSTPARQALPRRSPRRRRASTITCRPPRTPPLLPRRRALSPTCAACRRRPRQRRRAALSSSHHCLLLDGLWRAGGRRGVPLCFWRWPPRFVQCSHLSSLFFVTCRVSLPVYMRSFLPQRVCLYLSIERVS